MDSIIFDLLNIIKAINAARSIKKIDFKVDVKGFKNKKWKR